MMTSYIGEPISRVDGRAKVTGGAKYAAEHTVSNLAYGYVVASDVARGRITQIDATDALRLRGVLQVITHENAPRLPPRDPTYADEAGSPGSPFIPLADNEVRFSAQPVALVVAESFELARYAASLVRVEYDRQAHVTELRDVLGEAHTPKPKELLPPVPEPRGDADSAFAKAAVRLDLEYWVPIEHHNPMELYGTTVIREADGTLTVYDKTQGVQNVHGYIRSLFGYPEHTVRVLTPFMGGGFGSGLRPQYQVFLAVLAAHALKRSVRVSLTRQQMFGLHYRPATWLRVALGATPDGRLESIIHEAVADTSRFEDYTEIVVQWAGLLYRCENVRVCYQVAPLDLNTPGDMRAPGACWGVYAVECAMDELAATLRMDPLELRLRNYSESDQNNRVPFSSKALRECYRQGGDRFGWARRNPEPRSMREGDTLIGWGMATGMWEAAQVPASASAVLTADGRLTVSSATEDIGTGTYTIMTQIAAEQLGMPIEHVTFALGDSSFPHAPVEGGSSTASSVGSSVKAACDKVREQLFTLARKIDRSPIDGASLEDVTFADGGIHSRRDPSRTISFTEVMRQGKVDELRGEVSVEPSPTRSQHGCYTHSAIFAEVHVDADLGTIQVTRLVSAVAAGRILNPKTARSQVLGGLVWGIGMALEEESVIDQKFGRFINHNLAEYHVPVNADVHAIDVIFVEEHDDVVNPLGAKGLGEIGVVGVAAAIANAVFHATGRRIRNLPITLDKVM